MKLVEDTDKLVKEIILSTEYLDTTEGDCIPCVGIENLLGLLLQYGILSEEQCMKIQKETEG